MASAPSPARISFAKPEQLSPAASFSFGYRYLIAAGLLLGFKGTTCRMVVSAPSAVNRKKQLVICW
jgi:hypothetical protein